MDQSIYDEMFEHEAHHWWFVARRRVLKALLKTLKIPANAKVLDAGCGSGGNLQMLSLLSGELYAFEMDDRSLEYAKKRDIAKIEPGMLPNAIPFSSVSFDLITLLDVLEHVEDDNAALKALADRMKPGAALCINVPAYQWLYVRHDRLHHHFRRYSKTDLCHKIEAAGLSVEFASYWNLLLFPVALLVRLLDSFGIPKNHMIGSTKPSAPINRQLYRMVSMERFVLPYIRLPFGLSLLVVARKPAASAESATLKAA